MDRSDDNMSGRKTLTRSGSRKQGSPQVLLLETTSPSTVEKISHANGPLLQGKYQMATRRHLSVLLDRLFADFTGLHFHIAWSPTSSSTWDEQTLPTGCSVCCRISGSPLQPDCKVCGPRQLNRALSADGDGYSFTCRLGVLNFWLPVRVRDETLGIAYLQALNHRRKRLPSTKRSNREAAVVVTHAAFGRAARLLRFVVEYAQTASLADLRGDELKNAGLTVMALEMEEARLRAALKHQPPSGSQAVHRINPESHAEQIVHRVLNLIQADYGKQITLQGYARDLGLNAAYLSDLFSRVLGVPFKTCLTAVRMAKAKAMLGNCSKNVSEVAFAVGYASENRFRIAFKNVTGLSPKAWRETMQIMPQAT